MHDQNSIARCGSNNALRSNIHRVERGDSKWVCMFVAARLFVINRLKLDSLYGFNTVNGY